ncbi:thiamine diphosphokinase [Clostridium sp.]|uniref:thiamine diphosphokinase n=1 Tax=Clostridium sp. TaxID=1506 RepID=UPI0026103983|nr:thiamine diphosphokinase [Clostridium sp.]
MRALIVTGGNIPNLEILKKYSESSDLIIGADKGCDYLFKGKIKPDYILGDFDSADKETIKYFKKLGVKDNKYKKEKDDTDTKIAVELAIEKGAKEIYILGATGTRIDHVLSNLGLMLLGLKHSIKVELIDEYNRIFLTDKSLKIKGNKGDIVSFHAYSEVVESLSIKGAKYELNNYNLLLGDGITTSNEFVDKDIEITFNKGKLIIIYSKD